MIWFSLMTSLASAYITHKRPRITRVLVSYVGGEESLSWSSSHVESSSYMSWAARSGPLVNRHGGPRPDPLVGRRRGEYPLVQDTVRRRATKLVLSFFSISAHSGYDCPPNAFRFFRQWHMGVAESLQLCRGCITCCSSRWRHMHRCRTIFFLA